MFGQLTRFPTTRKTINEPNQQQINDIAFLSAMMFILQTLDVEKDGRISELLKDYQSRIGDIKNRIYESNDWG